ncbi:MAG: hypothetical protein ACMUIG_02305 [Thermoplasmatota archaeon]
MAITETSAGNHQTRGGLDDPLDFEITFYSGPTYYPGSEDRMYVYLYNTYDGSGFEGENAPTNDTTLEGVMIDLLGIFDEDGSPVTEDPIEWENGEFYNNGGDGYQMARYTSRYFYSDASSNPLSFNIKSEDIRPGAYLMRFRVSYFYMTDWDTGIVYTFKSTTYDIERSFNVRSYLYANGWPDYNLYAFSESFGWDTLYSGASHKLFGLSSTSSLSGTLTDITGTLSFPGLPITVDNPSVNSETMPNYFAWRINVPSNLPPGIYEAQIGFSYTRNGDDIVELPNLYSFEVEYTPLLMAPPDDDLETPFAVYNRASLPNMIEVPFINNGNVDLSEVTVSLDMSNARYVENSQIWFDENNNGNDVYEDQEVTIPSIPVGETGIAEFNMINFLPRMPPGLYKIPMDYIAHYEDMGETGNSPGDMMSGYWNEMGYYQHRNILRDITYPENNNEEHMPYLLIRIVDDSGPMFTGFIDNNANQYPGTVNAYMRLKVENHEMYDFFNLVYRIHVDDGSPFAYPYSSGSEDMNETTLPPIYRSGISDSSSTGTGTDYLYFYANIRRDAVPGLNYFTVDVEGVDQFNQPFQLSFMAYVTVRSQQPRFEMMSAEIGNISDDRVIPVTVHMTNVGLGGASNMTVYYKSGNSGINNIDDPVNIGDVAAGESFAYTFHLKPESDSRYLHGSYSGNMYYSFYDDIGEFTELMSGSSVSVRFDIYAKLPDLRIIHANAPIIDRGDTVTVTITVMNFGGSLAEDIRAIIPYSNAYFMVEEGIKELGDLDSGETVTFTWEIEGGDEFSDGSTYSFTIYFSYTDVEGRTLIFSEGESESFSLRTRDRVIPSEQRTVVKDDGVIVSEGAGSVILGILILIGLIIFGSMMAGKGGSAASPKEEKVVTPKRKPSPKLTVEEEEGEDMDEDEEEEEEEEEEEGEEEEDEGDW